MAKQSVLNIAADPALLYEILTDHESLSEWLPHTAKSRLLAVEGDLALAEVELRDEENTRCVIECIRSRDGMVVWRPIDKQVSVTEFQWNFSAAGSGRSTVTASSAKPMSLSLKSSPSAQFLDPDACLEALKDYVSLFAAEEDLAPGCEKLLEIVETESGLVCWLRGRKYRLVPEAQ